MLRKERKESAGTQGTYYLNQVSTTRDTLQATWSTLTR